MAGGQLAHRAGINFLLRGPQVLAHGGGQLSKALCRQLGTKGGGALAAARQKERRLALHALGHRVAGAAMGRDELPVLPGAAQCGREHLHAGKAGQHHRLISLCLQTLHQCRSPGVKPGVAAVQERGVLTPGGVEQLQYFIRQVGGGTVLRAASRQGRQQPTGP